MRVLFVLSTPSAIEPLGVLLLAAICRRHGHLVDLAVSRRGELLRQAKRFAPEVVAYSATSADIPHLKRADGALRRWARAHGRRLLRVMGGPHPTYCPEVLAEMELDAICQGDGDEALPELLRRHGAGESLEGIPNIATTAEGARELQVVADLDRLPFCERELYHRAVPYARASGLRSLHTGRGCPFRCTYCFNHVYNTTFARHGPLLRRRSVSNVLAEIEQLIARHPPVRMLRFSDDVFALRADAWLHEFAEQYRRRVGLPFYCLMRPNTFTEATAQLLAHAGCQAVGMGIEAGSARVRNQLLGRQMTDETVMRAFDLARRLGIRTYAGVLLGVPGTGVEDDLETMRFSRRVGPTVPVFTVTQPYKGTEMWRRCVQRGDLTDAAGPQERLFGQASGLTCFSPTERRQQLRIAALGPLYVTLPAPLHHAVERLIRGRAPIPAALLRTWGLSYYSYRVGTRIYARAIPRDPRALLRAALDNVRHL